MKPINISSRLASNYFSPMEMSEYVFDSDDTVDGVYIGRSLNYNLPFLLNMDKLVNPHISILGMSGSGKTYLLKSLILRYSAFKNTNILVIDWNSEYTAVVDFLGGKVYSPDSAGSISDFGVFFSGLSSIDISKIADEDSTPEFVSSILDEIMGFMHSSGAATEAKNMVIIDESWKLAGSIGSLAKLFREARKYGFSIVTASQQVNDFSNGILANSACNFIFRLNGAENLSSLVYSDIIDNSMVSKISSLERGSCLVSLSLKGRKSKMHFILRKIDGLDIDNYFITDGEMVTIVVGRKMKEGIGSLKLTADSNIRLQKFFEDNARRVELGSLLSELYAIGIDRPKAIMFLRTIGIPDLDIAISCESLDGVSNKKK